ncbi:hypothetical protein BDK51DRAFT_34415 [Blyttiomyces helicus]|uniref:Uncharacterized protein n=1 Tax=Blyttiomyces helicus TaxID=388810 RepID=A0A4P9W5X9_9FUNG|nr:hypothetical protein BDK51DRAFT_34415 [Blyttiomyces helicus]|eukprot:RKO87839.1 hypothetical protein BDK51DRAFT_34415 [Blyttiomyces helicus]
MDKTLDDAESLPCEVDRKVLDCHLSPSPVAFSFFKIAARKRSAPFKRFSVALEDGRIDRYVLSDLNLTTMYIWQDDAVAPSAVHRHQAFSTSTLDQVKANFSIEDDNDPWSMHLATTFYPLPTGLSDSISIIAASNSMQSESACRTIISLYPSYALHTVEPEAKFLTITEEVNIDVIKKVEYGSISEMVQYNGPVRFLVGHSHHARYTTKDTPCDASLLASMQSAEPRSKRCSARSSHKLLAFCAIAETWRAAGSDGEGWVFGYVCPEGTGKTGCVRKSDANEGRLKPGFDKEGCEQVFNHVVGLVSCAFRSTPRNSLVDLSETGDYSEEEADGGEDDPDADPSLIESVVHPLSSVRL